MDIESLLKEKNIKPKAKTEAISQMLLDGNISMKALINVAKAAKDPDKATCIEAMEFATQTNPAIATVDCLNFVSTTLAEKAPRIKWESARVVGNIAPLFPDKLDEAIKNLLLNSEHTGTVVRWSAAFALGEILKLKTKHYKDLIPAFEAICDREEKNSIKKIYLAAIKKSKISG
jgi:HEAT repeat protein